MARLPNFLYVGASKSGSTWIYEALNEHPQVFVPAAKDVKFFNEELERGLEWYRAYFEGAEGFPCVGELSHDYFLDPEWARRIHDTLGPIKVLVCLREPIARAVSQFHYDRSVHLPRHVRFEDYAQAGHCGAQGRYLENLRPFYERFGAERVGVLFYETLAADPAAFARELYGFLGVDPDFVPDCLHRRVLPARAPRNTFVAHRVYEVGAVLRRLGLANVVGAVKHHPTFNRLFYQPLPEKYVPPPHVRRVLFARYAADYPALSALIGRELPAAWYEAG